MALRTWAASSEPSEIRSANALEALRTVDRLVAARQEGHLRLLAALRAGRGVHLTAWAVVAAAAALAGRGRVGEAALTAARLLARRAAVSAAAGVVDEAAA